MSRPTESELHEMVAEAKRELAVAVIEALGMDVTPVEILSIVEATLAQGAMLQAEAEEVNG